MEESNAMLSFVNSITGGVTGQVTLTLVAGVIAAIITAGIVAVFSWKFARKGYNFVVKALSGRTGKI